MEKSDDDKMEGLPPKKSEGWEPDPVVLAIWRGEDPEPDSRMARALSYVHPYVGEMSYTIQTGVCSGTRVPISELVYDSLTRWRR